MRDVNNSEDILDSRDVEARIEELESTLESAREELEDEQDETDDEHKPEIATCGTCGLSWDDARVSGRTPTPSARCPFEHVHEEAAELAILKSLRDDAEGYAEDWKHGVTLIRDSYFKEYAEQLAEDIGALDANATWPKNCIDWDQAARELQMDYTSVEFDGVTYWVR